MAAEDRHHQTLRLKHINTILARNLCIHRPALIASATQPPNPTPNPKQDLDLDPSDNTVRLDTLQGDTDVFSKLESIDGPADGIEGRYRIQNSDSFASASLSQPLNSTNGPASLSTVLNRQQKYAQSLEISETEKCSDVVNIGSWLAGVSNIKPPRQTDEKNLIDTRVLGAEKVDQEAAATSNSSSGAILSSASPITVSTYSSSKSIRIPLKAPASEPQSSTPRILSIVTPTQSPSRSTQSIFPPRNSPTPSSLSANTSMSHQPLSALSTSSFSSPQPPTPLEVYETPQRRLSRKESSSSISLQRLSVASSQLMLQERYARTAKARAGDLLDSFFTLCCCPPEGSGCEEATVMFYTSDEYPCSMVCKPLFI